MNTILFILCVMWIWLGICILKCPDTILEKWFSNMLAIILIVYGCAKAGVILFDLVG